MSGAFAGARLRQALDFQRRTAKDLAETLGISELTLSRYARGRSAPLPETLQRIAVELGLPTAFFFRSLPTDDGAPVFYRSLAAATKRARRRSEARFEWLREIARYLQEYVELPTVAFPSFELPRDPAELVDEDIEELAQKTRRFWELGNGPIASVMRLVERAGGLVARVDLGAHTLDAFSQWSRSDDRPYFVIGSDKGSAVRSRWDLAHELGHMVLHRRLDTSMVYDSATFKLIEKQAHYFAGAFLLPAGTFSQHVRVPTLDGLLLLKRVWGVSVAGMIRRCRHLGLITESREQQLWQNYSRRGWRPLEPLDDELPPEEPQLLRRAVELIVGEVGIPRQQLLADLPFEPGEVQALCSLPLGFFREPPASLKVRSQRPADGAGRVLRFPGAPGPEPSTT